MADIFASMDEQDYARFKTNADIDLVRLGLGFVCVGVLQVVSNSPTHFLSRVERAAGTSIAPSERAQ